MTTTICGFACSESPGCSREVQSETLRTNRRINHLCGKRFDDSIVAAGRLHLNSPEEAQIRYMAVEPTFQGRGAGAGLLKALEEKAQQLGCRFVTLNSRESARGFYEKHGYRVVGSAPTLFGTIVHAKMTKQISQVKPV